ncbi:MAG TPA: hypothetical protein PKY50_06085 [Candidatus Competibacter sp.]|nr:hypothetical protein [Candidatus Competibacter sp.]
MNDMARIAVLENTVEQHATLLARAVAAIEAQTAINERLALHLEDSKRVWATIEEHGLRLQAVQAQQVEICAFCTNTRKIGWAVAVFASGGLAYLIKFWADHHGSA